VSVFFSFQGAVTCAVGFRRSITVSKDMQRNSPLLGFNGKHCISKTSLPGHRCLQPLNATFDLITQNLISEAFGYDGYQAAAPSPVSVALDDIKDTTICVERNCSAAGTVLVDGIPCDPGELTLTFILSRSQLEP
jgi:hypothetical protein